MSRPPRLWPAQLAFILFCLAVLAMVEIGRHQAEKGADQRERVRWLGP